MKKTLFLLFITQLAFSQKTYFQQKVDYTINVKLNDVSHQLSAEESIVYTNNSPDTLTFIYFHLWANAYKDNNTALVTQMLEHGERDLYFAKDADRGYIDSLNFKTDNKSLKIEYDKNNIDICKVYLQQPLYPNQTATITTPFKVKIPSARFSRLGHDMQAYYITQWYPKPAVYDANGWNPMPYSDQGEFYSEFGSFDVSITLPKNYVLNATGDRFDNDEEEKFIQQKITATEEKIKLLDSSTFVADMSFPKSDSVFKTVRFRQDNVHDFAWFADKRYNVLRSEMRLPHTKKAVTTSAYFTDKNIDLWKDAITYISDATFYYSLWNGDYAYNNVSAVDGTIAAGGGMEYPTVTLIGDAQDAFELDVVITHEVGHNWFYGMLGNNERKSAWMDEGINSFYEMRYIKTKYPKATLAGLDSNYFSLVHANQYKQAHQYYIDYATVAKQNADQACRTSSPNFTEENYGAIVYSKTALIFNYLMNYMGENDFDIAMQFYFDQCKFKHPKPADLRKTLEYFSGKKLDWFFNCLLGSTKKLNYKITSSKKLDDGSYEVTVKNVGEILGPVALCGLNKTELIGMVWYDGFEGSKTLNFPSAKITSFKIDYNEIMPDINRRNNTIRTSGILKKLEPLKPEFLLALDNPYKTQLFFSPIMGYNLYNKYMLGAAYYNHFSMEKKFETEIAPMYAFGNKNISGMANARVNLHPDNIFSTINIGFKSQRFASENYYEKISNYNKFAPYVNLDFKKRYAISPYQHRVTYRYIQIINGLDFFQQNKTYGVHDLMYQFSNSNGLYPMLVKVNGQANNDMQKVSVTYTQKIFVNKKKYFEIRAFAGIMNYNVNSTVDYQFKLSGWNGSNDYLYDNLYLGRNESQGLAGNQFTETEGAFKVYTAGGRSANWLAAVNIKSPKIFKLPILLYADFGACTPDKFAAANQNLFVNAGVDIVIMRDVFEIFIPIPGLTTNNLKTYNTLNNIDYLHQIRFTLNLNKINPFVAAKQVISF